MIDAVTIPCPTCPDPKKTVAQGDRYFPFCSQQCRDRDLDNWSSGQYRVAGSQVSPQDIADEDDEAS